MGPMSYFGWVQLDSLNFMLNAALAQCARRMRARPPVPTPESSIADQVRGAIADVSKLDRWRKSRSKPLGRS